MEQRMLLRDPEVFPSKEVLEKALGKYVGQIFESFIGLITNEDYGLDLQWRYYNDGKAWLGKATYKKKTVLWISIWDGFFKTSFHFSEKHREAILALDISETIKREFSSSLPSGKLISLILDVSQNTQVDNLMAVVRFKKSLI